MTIDDICTFIDKRDAPNSFATVCGEDDAEFVVPGETPVCFKFCKYSDAQVERILAQTEQWQLKVEYTEDRDPEFGYKETRIEKTSFQEINRKQILVKDGDFAGLITYSEQSTFYSCEYYFSCVLLPDAAGAPALLYESSGYGSSDMDTMWSRKTYLAKKETP